MAELDTNFVDAVLSANMNGKKRVRLTQIAENEYIVEDITEYEKVGSEYGQKEINTLNETVNGKVNKVEVIDDLDTVKAVTEDNVPVGCKAVTKFANDVNQSLVKHSHTWDSITGKPSAFPPSSSDLLNKIYPVGSIYMSINNVSPQAFIGGTWEQIKNRWLVGAGDEYAVGTYGGNAVHSHTQRMIFTANYAGNNGLMYTAGGTTPTDVIYTGETRSVPPYYAVYMWKRIA